MLFGTLIATGFAANYTRKQWLSAEVAERRALRAYVAIIGPNLKFDGTKTLSLPI
jgi:hypothetical protein